MVSERNAKKREEMAATAAIQATKPAFEKIAAGQAHLEESLTDLHQKTERWANAIDERQSAVEEYLSAKEKAELYKLNTPVDIADLGDAEKRILLAVLYQLSANEEPTTPEQQNYVRAVQQYLKIYNPQTMIDLEAVENIEDTSAQRAVLQASLEFFYLGSHPRTYSEEQMEFLDNFQVGRKKREEIISHIEAIVEVVGLQGLAEKYGIVAEQPRSDFAKYNDNGPIPEKVADLCVSHIKQGFRQFQSGEYALETKDYLVMCKIPWKGWEKIDAKDNIQNYGFFGIEKYSGKVTRINIDYKKDFPFAAVENLSFCIQENTIYFMENGVDREKRPEVQLVSIDFAKKEFQKEPFKFSISSYNVPVRFHISCSKAYVIIYTYLLVDFNCTHNEDSKRPLSKIFVMDLTQGKRVFTIEPDLIVRDAFIHEDQFVVVGATREETHTGFRYQSLFRYDVKSKKIEDMFPEYAHTLKGMMWPSQLDGFMRKWIDDYRGNCIVERLLQTESKWYLLCRIEDKRSRNSMDITTYRLLSFPHPYGDKQEYAGLEDIFTLKREYGWEENTPVLLDHKCAISWEKLNDTVRLMCYDFSSGEITYPDKGADSYIRLGDYLYKRVKTDWYKTNISQGWEPLQWELVSF